MDSFVFPGQGSQKVGMGGAMFDEVKEFLEVQQEVDAILGYSIKQLCLEDPEKRLNNTEYTQPSLYVVNALHYYKSLADGMQPRLLAGHSLGEYNALLAAGVFDFLTGLRLVKKRGELMGQAKNGAMAAVVGLSAEQVSDVLLEHNLTSIDVANYNSPDQIVISGPSEDIANAKVLFEQAGAKMYVSLPVSAAFHSRYMQDAANEFDQFLRDFQFHDPQIPVIANISARPYKKGDPALHVRDTLTRQIASPVRWSDSVRYMVGRGASQFHEIGAGQVLSRLIKKINLN